jgi:hypothetical protein
MDAGFPQIGKGRLVGSPSKLVWLSSVCIYVSTLEASRPLATDILNYSLAEAA